MACPWGGHTPRWDPSGPLRAAAGARPPWAGWHRVARPPCWHQTPAKPLSPPGSVVFAWSRGPVPAPWRARKGQTCPGPGPGGPAGALTLPAGSVPHPDQGLGCHHRVANGRWAHGAERGRTHTRDDTRVSSATPPPPSPRLAPRGPLAPSGPRGASNTSQNSLGGAIKAGRVGRWGDSGNMLVPSTVVRSGGLLSSARLGCRVREEDVGRRETFSAEWLDLELSTRPEDG